MYLVYNKKNIYNNFSTICQLNKTTEHENDTGQHAHLIRLRSTNHKNYKSWQSSKYAVLFTFFFCM